MDAGRLRRETGSLCHSFHGLTRVMAVAVQGFQAYFDVRIPRHSATHSSLIRPPAPRVSGRVSRSEATQEFQVKVLA